MALGAPIGRREENKRRKNEALQANGLSLFGEVGFEAASIEQIAQRADVARGTFYLYYPDKLALFQALMERFFEPIAQALCWELLDADGDSVPIQVRYESIDRPCVEALEGLRPRGDAWWVLGILNRLVA